VNETADTGIPYTHWAYFKDRTAAEQCAAELAAMGFACGIKRSYDDQDWLLRAHRQAGTGELLVRHALVEATVACHGGEYDGGEGAWLDPATLEPEAWREELGEPWPPAARPDGR
jgi:hypothetical protein